MTAYRLLYDAAHLTFPAWPVAVAGVPAGLVGALLLRYAGRRRAAQWIGTTLAIFGAAWAVIMGVGLYGEHARLRASLGAGDYTIVEGIVHDRPPHAASDRSEPAWVVESGPTAHWYRYGGSLLTVGYHRTQPGDGGLRDGAHVRLRDVGGRIARVEVETP